MKRRFSIAFVCDPIGESKAGIIVSTLRFAAILRARGHKVVFVGARGMPENDTTREIPTYRYRSIPLPKSDGWRLALPTPRELAEVFAEEDIDVVHVTIPTPCAIAAARVAKKRGMGLVAHSHSQPENLSMVLPGLVQRVANPMWNKFLAWVYGKADLLIYPSPFARDILEPYKKVDVATMVISNGVDAKEFSSRETGDFLERFDIPRKPVKILFVGRLFPEKSVHTLVEAMATVVKATPESHLMIVGGGYLRASLESLVERLRLQDHVTFLGIVDDVEKVQAYNASDVFVLPSLAELEGMVVLEAMATGLPIIVSDAEMSASKFFVRDNGFLFRTGDAAHLAERITTMVRDATLRSRMARESLRRVEKYDIGKSVDLLEEAYHSVLEP